jgi:hypothetical protein
MLLRVVAGGEWNEADIATTRRKSGDAAGKPSPPVQSANDAGFNWTDAGIGAGGGLVAAVLLVVASALIVRRRREPTTA